MHCFSLERDTSVILRLGTAYVYGCKHNVYRVSRHCVNLPNSIHCSLRPMLSTAMGFDQIYNNRDALKVQGLLKKGG